MLSGLTEDWYADYPVRMVDVGQNHPGQVLVIGYGNDLRGDDGIGQVVAKALWSERADQPELDGTCFIWSTQLLPEMALDLSRSGFAVFVDATHDNGPPGTVNLDRVPDPDAGRDGPDRQAASVGCWQDLSPTALVSLAGQLYDHAPEAVLVTVCVGVPGIGLGLSTPVCASVPIAAETIRRAIVSWRRPGQHPKWQQEPVAHA
jgi:hydrogenase maturation protease